MFRTLRLLATSFLIAAAGPALAQAAKPAPLAELVRPVNIPYETFTLDNGLRVAVHTDRKAPVVAVSVWYHVGSKDEPKGKTGFAHLFEHLMFNGSENYNGEWFDALEQVGATDYNGTTWFDRTNYFQNVPTPALEYTLFLESDRMGHLLGAVTKEKLDNQRGVVQNEKRQGDNEPYGLVEYSMLAALFPEGHPYRHSTIGSMEDLDAASIEDVRQWFRTHYGPNNAVLVLAGDIDARTARPLVEKYFGAIPRGPEPRRVAAPVPVRKSPTRETMRDQVANTRLYRAYVLPSGLDPQAEPLEIAATILAGGGSSRLYNDLVRDRQLAVSVGVDFQPFERVSMAQFTVDVKPGVDPALVERRVDELWAQFLKNGPTADEVQRVATRAVANTIRGLEQVGGFGGKAVTLAEGMVYANDPEHYRKELERYASATPAQVADVARRWYATGEHRLTVVPGAREADDKARAAKNASSAVSRPRFYQQPGAQAAAKPTPAPKQQASAPRRQLPEVKGFPDLDFPDVERATLSNGVVVELVRRTTVPVVQLSMSFDAGNAADPKDKLGTQALMLALVDEGTTTRSARGIVEEQERLGASIGAGAGMDRTRFSMSALKPNLAATLDLFADVLRNPTFDPRELQRVRAQLLSRIAQESTQPTSIALRELPPLIYGRDHPYGVPFTGSGTAAGVTAATRDDLVAFHRRWIRPDNGRVFVVGDVTMAEIRPLLEKSIGTWRAPSEPKGSKAFRTVQPSAGRVILIDRPGSPQSLILAGHPLQTRGRDNPVALYTANDILGGNFTSRLNRDLRETKGWAYGVGTQFSSTREQLPFILYAPVQTDRTGDSIKALTDGMRGFLTAQPATAKELGQAVNNSVRSLPGSFESAGDVLGALERNFVLERPDDYQETLDDKYRALTIGDLSAAAKAIDPSKLIWVVVGDRAKVEPQLRTLGLPIEVRAGTPAPAAE